MQTNSRLSLALVVTLILALSNTVNAEKKYNAPLHNLVNSICQIVVETDNEPHLLTGFFFKEDKDNYYIMTAGHGFIGNVQNVVLNLYYEGHALLRVPCQTIAVELKHGTMHDYAILKISKKALDKYPAPHIIEVNGDTSAPVPDSIAYVWGCARGEWPVGMKVHIEKTFKKDTIDIEPDMVGGMSGSPVVNENGQLIGMVLWQNGYCVSVVELHKFINKVFSVN